MKCLSLTQPYATLVVANLKRIETRNWHTKYRGKIAIHASGLFPKEYRALCEKEPFKSTLANIGIDSWAKLPLGQIIGVARLVNCHKIPFTFMQFPSGRDREYLIVLPPRHPEYEFGDYTPNRYAWILDGAHPINPPITAKGHLGLWSFSPLSE